MSDNPETGRNSQECVGHSPSSSFAPVVRDDARILILGSLPGQRSLAEQQYYAHPQNAFWRIMRDLFGVAGSYQERCDALVENGIALWDVLAQSVRPGSMDSDIDMRTATPNDFQALFTRCPDIKQVCFNGQKAAQMFARLVVADAFRDTMTAMTLPSTSPAYAAMPYEEKLALWRMALQ